MGISATSASSSSSDGDTGQLAAIRNEFALVGLRVVAPGGCSRLRIEDLRTRRAIELDALELEALAWSTHADLAPLLDPSHARWTDADEESAGKTKD